MKVIIKLFITFSVLLISGCTPLVANENYKEVVAISGGNWEDPTIWSSQNVPTEANNVIIPNGIKVFIGEESETLLLGNNLTVEQGAILMLGFNGEGNRSVEINGSLVCDGTISSGRGTGSDITTGAYYSSNRSFVFNLNNEATKVSGKGYFHVKGLVFNNQYSDIKSVTVDHYNIIVDGDFTVESTSKVTIDIDHFTYLNIKGSFATTGNNVDYLKNDSWSVVNVGGIVVTDNVNLYGRNELNQSRLTILSEGSLYTQKVNNNLKASNSEQGFRLKLKEDALFRCGEFAPSPDSLASADRNLNLENSGEIRLHFSKTNESVEEILKIVEEKKPENNPEAYKLKDVIGASHIKGWYYFTDKPFLIEGIDAFKEMGSSVFKTSLSGEWGKIQTQYPYNSEWPNYSSMLGVAKNPMMDTLFSTEYIKTHAMWVNNNTKSYYKEGPDKNHDTFLYEEEQIYNLAVHFFKTYGDKDKRFILQNWEGDWMLRGSKIKWEKDDPIPTDVDWRVEGMARMFRAMMRGLERARAEYPLAKAQILLGVEFNKLFYKPTGGSEHITMMDSGIPCVLADVITKCRLDLSSWSSYDGNWSYDDTPFPYAYWTGIRIAEYFTTNTSQITDGVPVQIGEYGKNENPLFIVPKGEMNPMDEVIEDIEERYSKICGTLSALGVQYFYMWNLYGSGEQDIDLDTDDADTYTEEFLYQVLDGKWVIEPDGSWGIAAEYLIKIFNGEVNPPTSIDRDNTFANSIVIYPNPAQNELTIKANSPISSVTIYSIEGREIRTTNTISNSKIDVSELRRGYYFMKASSNNNIAIIKFFKK
ncbi:T9SS type A sorting domain-containing protein [Flammeovirga kamogawensis]|uniref:T9SS type A sorting domain-containing protein n=1 Tax=Flammeovirga kamogawensis TaxID=373891 RepID=A0ABX8H231_9BACT|nr:T9SS type A sorting domain-containing protein [Flammeovirga kamogawensis]MBB6462623.1 hypothetical protein [Flammeovirga kamogawensis]QWG09632.1 T9SS type A sorting domain-containing protein [Flammeovirga kamogawensis]TRX65146.1 T9SS type A sorting domain-containing protein [Flammeovirga kamogawensis]